jgi:hypothetical protein
MKHLDKILAALEAQLPNPRPSTESLQSTAANGLQANAPRDRISESRHSPERTVSDSVQKRGEERKHSPCSAAATLKEDAPGVSETGRETGSGARSGNTETRKRQASPGQAIRGEQASETSAGPQKRVKWTLKRQHVASAF